MYKRYDIPPREEHELEEWLTDHLRKEDTGSLQQDLDDLGCLNRHLAELSRFDTEKALDRVEQRIQEDRRKKWSFRFVLRVAAVLLPLLIGGSIWMFRFQGDFAGQPAMQAFRGTAGTVTYHTLPDGSGVWLNGGSSLQCPVSFDNGIRTVSLSGEAYFKVKADSLHPFVVETVRGNKITAYGTEFTVSSFTEEPREETFLVRGSISFTYNGSELPIKAGERVSYLSQEKRLLVERADSSQIVSWKDGKLEFKNTPLSEIVRKLEHRFDVVIRLNDPDLKGYLYTASFTTETLPQIFEMLQVSTPKLYWETPEKPNLSKATSVSKSSPAKRHYLLYLEK